MNVKIESLSARISNREDADRVYDIEGSVVTEGGKARVESGNVRSLDGMEGVASFAEYDNGSGSMNLSTTFEKAEGRAAMLALIEDFVASAKEAAIAGV